MILLKIAFFNPVYNIGSTGKLIHNLAMSFVKDGHKVSVFYFRGDPPECIEGYRITDSVTRPISNVMERFTGLIGCYSRLSTKRAIDVLRREMPDIVYLGNMHGCYINVYRLYSELKELNIPTVQIMWDEYSMTGSCAFTYDCDRYMEKCKGCQRYKEYPKSWFFDTSGILQEKKRKAYEMDNLVFVSVPYTAQKARRASIIDESKVYAVDEAIDQNNVFYPRQTGKFRKNLGISDDKRVFLNVCVYPSERKGGEYYLELARKCLDISDAIFVHVGFLGDYSECPMNYIPIGYEENQEIMAHYYSMADLFVCTSLAETQPNTCLEALSCGTPICGFDISGVPTCAEYPFGEYVEPRNTDELKDIVCRTQKKTDEKVNSVREYAESRFSSDDYYKRLLRIGLELYSKVTK